MAPVSVVPWVVDAVSLEPLDDEAAPPLPPPCFVELPNRLTASASGIL